MRKVVSATIWSVFDRVWAQIIGFVIGIILARLLTPEEYGLVGISVMFIAFANVFIEAGFSNALIRKLDRTNADYSTAFYFSALMGLIMYIILYISAPWIAVFFEDDQLVLLTRFVCLAVVFNSLCIVQNAILTAELKMRQQAVINISAQIPSGLLAVWLAYRGYGIYALAVQTVLAAFLRTILFAIAAKWRPTMEFSMNSMRYLWGFGSKLIGANFLGSVFNEIYTVLIGKYVGKSDLGLYSKGRSLSCQPELVCTGVIQKVAVPLLANVQEDSAMLKNKYKELTRLVMCVMALISGILIVIAKPLILLLWGPVWEGTVPVFQVLLIASLISYVQSLTLVLLQIVNHTEYTLKLEFVKKPVYLVFIIVLLHKGLLGLMIALVLTSLWATIVNMSAPHKFISYSYLEQMKDVIPYFIACTLGGIVTYGISVILPHSYILEIVVGFVMLSLIYVGLLWLIHDEIVLKYGNMLFVKVKKGSIDE